MKKRGQIGRVFFMLSVSQLLRKLNYSAENLQTKFLSP